MKTITVTDYFGNPLVVQELTPEEGRAMAGRLGTEREIVAVLNVTVYVSALGIRLASGTPRKVNYRVPLGAETYRWLVTELHTGHLLCVSCDRAILRDPVYFGAFGPFCDVACREGCLEREAGRPRDEQRSEQAEPTGTKRKGDE